MEQILLQIAIFAAIIATLAGVVGLSEYRRRAAYNAQERAQRIRALFWFGQNLRDAAQVPAGDRWAA